MLITIYGILTDMNTFLWKLVMDSEFNLMLKINSCNDALLVAQQRQQKEENRIYGHFRVSQKVCFIFCFL